MFDGLEEHWKYKPDKPPPDRGVWIGILILGIFILVLIGWLGLVWAVFTGS